MMVDFRSIEERHADDAARLAYLKDVVRTDPASGAAEVTKALAWNCLLGRAVDEPDIDDLLNEIVLPRGGRLLSLATWLAEHVEHDHGGHRLWGALSRAGVPLRPPALARVPDDIDHLAEVLVGCTGMPMQIRLRAALQVLTQGENDAAGLVRSYLGPFEVSHLWAGDAEHDYLESFADDASELMQAIAATSGWPLKERVEVVLHLRRDGTTDRLPVELLAETEQGSEERRILLELLQAEEGECSARKSQPPFRSGGFRGALFTVEAAEKAWGLGAVNPYLMTAVRQQLTESCELNGSEETDSQIADSALTLSRLAVAYGELRQSLLRDYEQTHDEPPWRALRDVRIAVRIRRRLRHCEAFVLAPYGTDHASPPQRWVLAILSRPFHSDGRAIEYKVTLHQRRDGAGDDRYRLNAERELLANEELAQQALYGFSSLGLGLDSEVGIQCPGVGQRGRTMFLEPSDEWRVECHVCGTKWAGGSDILSEHQDLRYGFY
ncbi:hypothetical protein G3I18_12340 [Actinospica acidiphila]|uniref:Uncharacterized protein n=1 Tax=Actinospica acidiphila TaxID=304899 RepID=A0A9X5HBV4_9ACTN|nr:hypothetical protein [Actinospica acidiphila]NEC49354.1 hypothetical protein [Actinospica acidiphila]